MRRPFYPLDRFLGVLGHMRTSIFPFFLVAARQIMSITGASQLGASDPVSLGLFLRAESGCVLRFIIYAFLDSVGFFHSFGSLALAPRQRFERFFVIASAWLGRARSIQGYPCLRDSAQSEVRGEGGFHLFLNPRGFDGASERNLQADGLPLPSRRTQCLTGEMPSGVPPFIDVVDVDPGLNVVTVGPAVALLGGLQVGAALVPPSSFG